MKGASLSVGARAMAGLTGQIEEAAGAEGSPDWATLSVLADRLREALSATAK
jgi:hypothetical protein